MVSNPIHGPSYCRPGITYVDTSRCALSEMISHVLASEKMTIQLLYSYTVPSTIGRVVDGVAGQKVCFSCTRICWQ